MMQNWEEWLVHQMGVVLFRVTSAGWRNGVRGIS